MSTARATLRCAHAMLAVVLTACVRSDVKPTVSEPKPGASPHRSSEGSVEPSSAVALSRQWLRAFRDGDMAALRGLTCSPFAFRSTLGAIRCPPSAQGNDELQELAACIRSNDLLADELKYADEMPNSAEHRQSLPQWTQSLVAPKHSNVESVYAYLHGDGVTFGFALLAQKDCVEALLLNADFDEDTSP